jgi:hypothetical protein
MYKGTLVMGTMEDRGLIYHPTIEGLAYVSVYNFGEITIESIYPRDESEKNFDSAQIRMCHDKNTLANHGFTDIEVIE